MTSNIISKKQKCVNCNKQEIIYPNEYLFMMADPEVQKQLCSSNIALTKLAFESCKAAGTDGENALGNEIYHGTQICNAISTLNNHGVTAEKVLKLSCDNLILWPWSSFYGTSKESLHRDFGVLPLAIIFPRTSKEVQYWVKWIFKHKFTISIRSGNCCFESFSTSGQFIVDTSLLALPCKILNNYPSITNKNIIKCQIRIDKEKQIAHVAPGMRLGVLQSVLTSQGFAAVTGICSTVGVGGQYSVGGEGYLARLHGLAIDNLLELDIVLANGEKLTLNSSSQHQDLWRACKGAGSGNFGVITRYTFKIYPIVKVIYWEIDFNLKDAPDILPYWQIWGGTAPEQLSGNVSTLISGQDTFFINGLYIPKDNSNESVEMAENELKALIYDGFLSNLNVKPNSVSIEVTTFRQAATTLSNSYPTYRFDKTHSDFVFTPIEKAGWEQLVAYLSSPPIDNDNIITGFNFPVWGPNSYITNVSPIESVFVARKGTVGLIFYDTYWKSYEYQDIALAYSRGLQKLVESLTSEFCYYGQQDLDVGPNYMYRYFGSNTDFLEQVKKQVDPTNFFHFAQSVPLPT